MERGICCLDNDRQWTKVWVYLLRRGRKEFCSEHNLVCYNAEHKVAIHTRI